MAYSDRIDSNHSDANFQRQTQTVIELFRVFAIYIEIPPYLFREFGIYSEKLDVHGISGHIYSQKLVLHQARKAKISI